MKVVSVTAAVVVVIEQACGGVGVEERGTEGRTVWHCKLLDGMGEGARGWMGRLGGGDS